MNIKFILQTKKIICKKKRMLRNLKIVTKIEIIVDKSKSRLDNNEEKKVNRDTKIKKKFPQIWCWKIQKIEKKRYSQKKKKRHKQRTKIMSIKKNRKQRMRRGNIWR